MAHSLIQMNSSFSRRRPTIQQFWEECTEAKQEGSGGGREDTHKILKGGYTEAQKTGIQLSPTTEQSS